MKNLCLETGDSNLVGCYSEYETEYFMLAGNRFDEDTGILEFRSPENSMLFS